MSSDTTRISTGITSQCVYYATPPEDTLVHVKAVPVMDT